MNLATKLTEIKGVGPKAAEQLALAGLATVGDLLTFLPRRHEDFSGVVPIAELNPGKVTIKARCEAIETRSVRRGLRLTTATLTDSSGKIRAVWFNQPYRAAQLAKTDDEFYFSGEFEFQYNRYQLTNPAAELVKDLPVSTDRIVPVYRAIRGLKSQLVRKILAELRPFITMLPDPLPPSVVTSQKLTSYSDALLGLHFPSDTRQMAVARERLAFQELFELILASQLNKLEQTRLAGYQIPFEQPTVKRFVDGLPFALTGAQKRAAWDILQDFERATPMNRLLQGDVGSGKTVVAGLAACQAASHGYQTALMAPTEILATQHADTLTKLLEPFGYTVGLLVGGVKGQARTLLYRQIASGEVDVVVGTHALFQDKVVFKNLGFVVIDEQHRFGVEQRQKLLAKSSGNAAVVGSSKPTGSTPESRAKRLESRDAAAQRVNGLEEPTTLLARGLLPHLLAMTATPIPRSLALTVYGELDVSILNELPAGRKPINTQIVSPTARDRIYGAIDAELAAGRQAYVVCSLIDDNPANDRKSAEAEAHKLRNSIFRHRRVGLLHGRMSPAEKDEVMLAFMRHDLDILVSTTVVEVGVDVPNATVMLIENADHFGLSQLHQLRGRVGRSEHQSYCYLMMSDTSKPTERLRHIEKSQDGFYLAEVDLQLRGPGEIYGRAQHGALNLQIATLADAKLIARAQQAAAAFIASGESLDNYKSLAAAVAGNQRLTTLN